MIIYLSFIFIFSIIISYLIYKNLKGIVIRKYYTVHLVDNESQMNILEIPISTGKDIYKNTLVVIK